MMRQTRWDCAVKIGRAVLTGRICDGCQSGGRKRAARCDCEINPRVSPGGASPRRAAGASAVIRAGGAEHGRGPRRADFARWGAAAWGEPTTGSVGSYSVAGILIDWSGSPVHPSEPFGARRPVATKMRRSEASRGGLHARSSRREAPRCRSSPACATRITRTAAPAKGRRAAPHFPACGAGSRGGHGEPRLNRSKSLRQGTRRY